MTLKRNDGYTLAYVVIVLAVIASVAMATMALALMPQKNQHLALERMQDKYAAQGLVEQVVAKLEHTDDINDVIADYAPTEGEAIPNPCCTIVENSNPITYRIVASSNKTTVTAEFRVEQITKTEDTGEVDENNNPITATSVIGHTVTYLSYNTEVAP